MFLNGLTNKLLKGKIVQTFSEAMGGICGAWFSLVVYQSWTNGAQNGMKDSCLFT